MVCLARSENIVLAPFLFQVRSARHLIQKSQPIQHDRDFARLEKHN